VAHERSAGGVYADYSKEARLFAKVIGRPTLMRELTQGGHAQHLIGWVLRIMANLLCEDENGPAELAYAAKLVKLAPNP